MYTISTLVISPFIPSNLPKTGLKFLPKYTFLSVFWITVNVTPNCSLDSYKTPNYKQKPAFPTIPFHISPLLCSPIPLLQVVSIMSPVLWILFHKYTSNTFFAHHFHRQCHCQTLSILLFDNSLSPGLLSSYLDHPQFITFPHFHQRTLFWQEAKKCSLFPQIVCVVK